MRIKICGLNDPENIKAVATLQPDFMGFIFYPASPRYFLKERSIEEQVALRASLESIPSVIQKVGVFVNESIKSVIRYAVDWDLNFIQLHGDESPEYCEELKLLDFPIIKAFGVDEYFDFNVLSEYYEHCSYFLFDTKTAQYGGSGVPFNWEILAQYKLPKPIILSGGITGEDIEKIKSLAANFPIEIVDMNSKVEISPGIKDLQLCRQAIEQCRN